MCCSGFSFVKAIPDQPDQCQQTRLSSVLGLRFPYQFLLEQGVLVCPWSWGLSLFSLECLLVTSRQALTWLGEWGLQSSSQAKDTSWFSGWSIGCPASTQCGSGPITKPLRTRLLLEHILHPDFCQYAQAKIQVFTLKSNPGDELVWQLCAVLQSQGDNKCCLARWEANP